MVYGVSRAYTVIANLQLVAGRFFDDRETEAAAPIAVLGEGAAASLFGTDDPVGRYIKVNDQWFPALARVVVFVGSHLNSLDVRHIRPHHVSNV